jgi:activator of 2-hydroxyglutaryl-CoA dehydratase
MVTAMADVLGQRPIVPDKSQYIGAVGAALLASGFIEGGR